MEQLSVVGIDVAKDKIDVCFLASGQRLAVSANGYEEFAALLAKDRPGLVVLEATGGYERPIVAALAAEGITLAVVNPKQVRHYAIALGIAAKTDALDAEVIARFGRDTRIEPRQLPDGKTRELQDLFARRRQLVQMRTAEDNRLQQTAVARVKKSIQAVLKTLAKQIDDVDGEIDRLVRENPVWLQKEEILDSLPGVGQQTARILLAEMPELGTLSRTEAAMLAGLAPRNRDSGRFRGARSIGGGRAMVRSALYMAALTAIRRAPKIKAHYQKLRAAGKKFKVAMVACMRKMLLIMNALLKHNAKFEPSHA